MQQFRPLPPRETVVEWLHYSPLSGVFTWMKDPSTGIRYRFNEAGCKRANGYIYISFNGFGIIAAHRLAWVYMYGDIPDGMEVDHIDLDPSNNTIANLRLATSSQQKMNKRAQSNNRSGLKGAYFHACHKGKKWRSQIKVGPRLIFLGYFHTAEEAHAAYGAAALEHFGEFARVA